MEMLAPTTILEEPKVAAAICVTRSKETNSRCKEASRLSSLSNRWDSSQVGARSTSPATSGPNAPGLTVASCIQARHHRLGSSLNSLGWGNKCMVEDMQTKSTSPVTLEPNAPSKNADSCILARHHRLKWASRAKGRTLPTPHLVTSGCRIRAAAGSTAGTPTLFQEQMTLPQIRTSPSRRPVSSICSSRMASLSNPHVWQKFQGMTR